MFRKQCSLIGFAILVVTASPLATSAQTAFADRQLPASALRTMKPQHPNQSTIGNGATKNAGLKTAASSGITGVDTIVNWSGEFVYPGYDSNGNPQSVWPYTMVGNSPESGQRATITAPVVPVTVQLLGPDGNVALTLVPNGKVINEALGSPELSRMRTPMVRVSLTTR